MEDPVAPAAPPPPPRGRHPRLDPRRPQRASHRTPKADLPQSSYDALEAVVCQHVRLMAYDDAEYYAEILCMLEPDSDDALVLRGWVHSCRGDHQKVYSYLKAVSHPRARYLFARACMAMERYREADVALSLLLNSLEAQQQDPAAAAQAARHPVPLPSLAYVNQMSGVCCQKLYGHVQAAQFYRKALELNPFMWLSFRNLCELGEPVEPNTIWSPSQCHATLAQVHRASQDPTDLSVKDEPVSTNRDMPSCEPDIFDPTADASEAESPSAVDHAPEESESEDQDIRAHTQRRPDSQPRRHEDRQPITAASTKRKRHPSDLPNVDAPLSAQPPSPSSKPTRKKASRKASRRHLSSPPDAASLDPLWSCLAVLGFSYAYLFAFQLDDCLSSLDRLPWCLRASSTLQCLRARVYYEKCDWQRSSQIFARVRDHDPARIEDMDVYSSVLWHLRATVELAALSQDLLLRHPRAVETYITMGNCFSAHRNHERAIRCFRRAVQLDPANSYAYTLLGHEHMACEDMPAATQAFQQALAHQTWHYNAFYGMGFLALRQERPSQASVLLQRAIAIHPTHPILLCLAATVHVGQGDFTSALALLDSAETHAPNHPLVLFRRAALLTDMDRDEESLQVLRRLQDLPQPADALSPYFLASRVLLKLGRHHEALQSLVAGQQVATHGFVLEQDERKREVQRRRTAVLIKEIMEKLQHAGVDTENVALGLYDIPEDLGPPPNESSGVTTPGSHRLSGGGSDRRESLTRAGSIPPHQVDQDVLTMFE